MQGRLGKPAGRWFATRVTEKPFNNQPRFQHLRALFSSPNNEVSWLLLDNQGCIVRGLKQPRFTLLDAFITQAKLEDIL